jgi:hypothetical protein
MPTYYKILGQVTPTANTNSNVYVVPAGYQAVVSTVSFCNANTTANSTVTMYAVKDGEQPSNTNIITNQAILPLKDTLIFTIGMTLAPGDRIVANTLRGDIGATVFGSESNL